MPARRSLQESPSAAEADEGELRSEKNVMATITRLRVVRRVVPAVDAAGR